jgi:hypothetical protein
VLTPLQHTPPKLVDPFIAYVRSFAIAELDPRLVL